MAKITAKEATVGMEFKLVSQEPLGFRGHNVENVYMPFAFKGDSCLNGVHVETGSKLIITKAPYTKGGGRIVDFKLENGKELSTFWTFFRNNTELLNGEKSKVKKARIISNGPFAGADIEVEKVESEDYTNGLGIGIFTIKFKFIVTLECAKKMSTKLINQVKKAPGFREKLIDLVFAELDASERDVPYYLSRYDEAQYNRHYRNNETDIDIWYNGGRLDFKINCTKGTLGKTKLAVIEKVDQFIAAKTTTC